MTQMGYRLLLETLDGDRAEFVQGGDKRPLDELAQWGMTRQAWETIGRPTELEILVGSPDFLERNLAAIRDEIEDPQKRVSPVKEGFTRFGQDPGPGMPQPSKGRPVRDEPQA